MYNDKSTNHMSSASLQSLLNCSSLKEDTSNFPDLNLPTDAYIKIATNSYDEKALQISAPKIQLSANE